MMLFTIAAGIGALGFGILAGWRTARDIRKRRQADFYGEHVSEDTP